MRSLADFLTVPFQPSSPLVFIVFVNCVLELDHFGALISHELLEVTAVLRKQRALATRTNIDKQPNRQTNKHTNKHTHTHTQTHKQTNNQTNK